MALTRLDGWSLHTIHGGQAGILGMPVFAIDHCAGPMHGGASVVRRDAAFNSVVDLPGYRFVCESVHSNSAMTLPRRMIARLVNCRPFFATILETHRPVWRLGTHRLWHGRCDLRQMDHPRILPAPSARAGRATARHDRNATFSLLSILTFGAQPELHHSSIGIPSEANPYPAACDGELLARPLPR